MKHKKGRYVWMNTEVKNKGFTVSNKEYDWTSKFEENGSCSYSKTVKRIRFFVKDLPIETDVQKTFYIKSSKTNCYYEFMVEYKTKLPSMQN